MPPYISSEEDNKYQDYTPIIPYNKSYSQKEAQAQNTKITTIIHQPLPIYPSQAANISEEKKE